MYLRKIGDKTDMYHEAGHIVFNNFLPFKRQNAYIERIKNELKWSPKQLEEAKQKLRARSSRYRNMSDAALERKVYEEQIMDKYADWQTKREETRTWLSDFFNSLKSFIDWLFNNKSLVALFNQIDRGAFRNAKAKNKYGEIDFKIVPGFNPVTSNVFKSQLVGFMINAKLPATLSGFEKAYDMLLSTYDVDNSDVQKFIKNSTIEDLETKMAVVWSRLSKAEAKNVLMNEVIKFFKKNKYNPEVEVYDDSSSEEGDRVYDKPANEIDPTDTINEVVRNFLATTLAIDKDIFGRPVETVIPWQTVYNRLLPVLSVTHTKSSDIIRRLSYMSKDSNDTFIQAVYERLIKETGYSKETPDGVGTEGKNLLIAFKNAFALEQNLYLQAVLDNGQASIHIENKKDLGQKTKEEWEDDHIKNYLNKVNADKQIASKVNKDFEHLLLRLSSNPADVELSKFKNYRPENAVLEVLNSVGIKLQKKHAQAAFGEETDDVEERRIVNENKQPIITISDIKLISEYLKKGQPLFSGEEGVDTLASQIKLIATADARYNPFIVAKTYQDAAGKKRYSYSEANMMHSEIHKLRTDVYNESRYNELLNRQNGYFKYNSLVNKSYQDAKNILNNLWPHLIYDLSVRDENQTEGITSKSATDGDFLVLMHMYYQRTIKNSETGNKPFSIFSMSQISDKTSQYGFFLPVDRYVTNGKLNELGKKDLWNMFKTDLFTKQEKFNTGYIFKGDLFFFEYLKSDINVGDYVKALISKETSIEDVTPEVENMIVKAIYDKLIQQANDHIKILQDMGLYDNVVTPALKKEYPNILDYFVNHQLNTFIKVNDAYKLIGGSPNYTKGWDDFIKRMGRIIAAGRDFSAGKSTTYHRVAFTDDQVVFVNPENFDEITTDSKKAKELGWDEINTTDAQVWSTTNSKLEDMRKLGLLTDALESVLLRMSVVKDNDGNLVFPNPDDVPTRDEIEAAGLDLIPSKQVTGGKTDDLKEVYNKMAVHYLSFVDLAYHDGEKWIPRPDRLSLYNKYMMMVNNDVTHLVPKSAAKMFYGSPVSHSFLNEYTGQTVNTYIVPDIYRRLQVQNSTKSKKNIVLSNQILNIIGSELPDTEENNRLKTRMQQSIARMKSQDLNFLDRILVGSDGKRPDLTVLLNTLMSIAEDSSGDSQMLEMLSHTNGKPNYDTNVAHISSKFTEMFFSRYKDVFRQKGFGRILTAVSSDGYNVIEDKDTGEIITDYTEYNPDKHKIRPLRGMRNSESGITPAEIFIPRKYAELYNLQVGQELTSDLFKTILYRVPSQSYHSAAIAKVVGFLPDYYGDTIVAPKEFVLLMGMDFDVDKLYMYSKAFYQNKKGEIIVYGKEKTLEQRFESYLKDLTENNPYIKAEYKRRLESDSSFAEVKEELKNARKKLNSIFEAKKELRIHKGVLQRLNRTMQDILGDDNSELDQESLSENILFIKQDIAELRNIVSNIPNVKEEIFDLMDSIVQRQEFELVQTLKYFNMPVNMEEFSKSSYIPKYQLWNDVVDSMYEIFSKSDLWDAFRMKLSTDRTDSFIETNKNKLSTADIVPGTPNAVYSSFKNARQGKVQTGIAVTNNTGIQFLLENNIVIDPEIIQETPIIFNNEIIRQFNIDDLNRESMDAGSEILGRIVDNQKNPVADKLNLTPETMGIAYIITKATGDLDLALLFLQSPTLKAISEAKKNSERVVNPVDYFGETTKILKNLDNKEVELKKKSPSLVVNYIPVTKQNLEWLINNLNYETLSDDDKAKYIGLEKEIYRNYSILKDIAGTTQAITTTLSLNRSIDSDIASAYRVLNAFDTVEKNKVLPNAYGALMSNPVNQVNYDILKHALRTLSLYQITETYYANNVIDTVLGMLSSSGRKKYHQDIINSFMSSLQMAVIEKNEGSLLKHAELLMKNPKSLANIVSEFKSRKEYENNVFLKLLSTKMNLKEEAYDLVTADSRSKLSPEAQAAILDASTYIMHKEPELFRKLEKYLQLMDGMMFRNGSFVKMMPAETFKSVAKALEDINEVLTGNYNNEQRIAKFKELTGYDFNEFKNRFIDQFFMHIVNKRLPRTDYKGYNKEGKTIFNKTFINGILKINLVDKTNPETDIQVFQPVYNEDETLLRIEFPRYLRIKLETGGYKGFRLKKKTDFSAEYEPIIYIGDKRRKPYSLSIADNIKLQQMLKQDIKQNTPDTVEESTNLISDDNSVFFEQESVGDIASQIPIDESTYIPAFGKAVAKPEEKLKINIYSGTGENPELSNFANRPFTDDGIGDLGMNYKEATGKSIVFNTVEGFFQASKIQYSNSSEYWDKSKDGWTLTKRGIELIEKFAKATGSEAKSLGRTIKELDTKEWDKYSSQEMKGGLLASFEQNPDALVKLLSTGNATLTHTQDKGKWGVEFPKLLMEVRTELAKQQTQNLWSQYQQASIENNKTVDLTQAEFEALSTEEQETIIYQIKNCK